MSSYPQVGQTYWVVKHTYRKDPASESKYIQPFGCHYGIKVDAPKFEHGQAFTSEQACRDGAWALRKDGMDEVYALDVVQARFVGDTLFTEVTN